MNSPAAGDDDGDGVGDGDGGGGSTGNRRQYSQANQMHLFNIHHGYVPNMHMYIHSYMYMQSASLISPSSTSIDS